MYCGDEVLLSASPPSNELSSKKSNNGDDVDNSDGFPVGKVVMSDIGK
eukprot:CAMPEP_0201193078 /NCGR_PEP_ID=MMETSP0851-20130426/146055_1 /ASSEMBLY_ACC=CAM_ASM_000631 /TAXON_ID=183588 /ORGANISM="Pseudo-nitzschia fraudulenta, Strain WWA7" /LENGTH=47 /DNA_ID= /DNA_START= /DNA_END= /DNA_ORIENTATION=